MHLLRKYKKLLFWVFVGVLLALLVRDAFNRSAGSWLAGVLLLMPTYALVYGLESALKFNGLRRGIRLFSAAIGSLYGAYVAIAFVYWLFLGFDPNSFEKSILNPVLLWVVMGFFAGVHRLMFSPSPKTPPMVDSTFLQFHSQRRTISIPSGDVLYIESLSDHTLIHRQEGEPLKNTVKISEWESRLPPFLRIHRSILINPTYASFRGSEVEVKGGLLLPISRTYKEVVKKYYTAET